MELNRTKRRRKRYRKWVEKRFRTILAKYFERFGFTYEHTIFDEYDWKRFENAKNAAAEELVNEKNASGGVYDWIARGLRHVSVGANATMDETGKFSAKPSVKYDSDKASAAQVSAQIANISAKINRISTSLNFMQKGNIEQSARLRFRNYAAFANGSLYTESNNYDEKFSFATANSPSKYITGEGDATNRNLEAQIYNRRQVTQAGNRDYFTAKLSSSAAIQPVEWQKVALNSTIDARYSYIHFIISRLNACFKELADKGWNAGGNIQDDYWFCFKKLAAASVKAINNAQQFYYGNKAYPNGERYEVKNSEEAEFWERAKDGFTKSQKEATTTITPQETLSDTLNNPARTDAEKAKAYYSYCVNLLSDFLEETAATTDDGGAGKYYFEGRINQIFYHYQNDTITGEGSGTIFETAFFGWTAATDLDAQDKNKIITATQNLALMAGHFYKTTTDETTKEETTEKMGDGYFFGRAAGLIKSGITFYGKAGNVDYTKIGGTDYIGENQVFIVDSKDELLNDLLNFVSYSSEYDYNKVDV